MLSGTDICVHMSIFCCYWRSVNDRCLTAVLLLVLTTYCLFMCCSDGKSPFVFKLCFSGSSRWWWHCAADCMPNLACLVVSVVCLVGFTWHRIYLTQNLVDVRLGSGAVLLSCKLAVKVSRTWTSSHELLRLCCDAERLNGFRFDMQFYNL